MPRVSNIEQFLEAIATLPEDEPQHTPGKWDATQKEHWLGCLSDHHG